MTYTRKKQLTFTIVLLSAFAFFCHGGALSTILMGSHAHMDMTEHDCCDITQTGAMYGDMSFTLPQNRNVSTVLVFVLLSLVWLWKEKFVVDDYTHYVRSKDRGGGFRLLNYFTGLFQKGILHPKVF